MPRSGRHRRGRVAAGEKVDVNAAAADTSTPLHWAVETNNLEIVNLLIDAGANVNAATRYKITPLSLACTNGNAAIIERLLKAGVDPNSTSEEGQTALMTAALNGKVDAIKMLLTHGAKVNATEPYKGQTALMWAAGEGNVEPRPHADRIRRRREGEIQSRIYAAAVRGAEQSDRRGARCCWSTARTSKTRLRTAPPR